MITTPTVSGKPGQAPTGLSCDLYPLIGSQHLDRSSGSRHYQRHEAMLMLELINSSNAFLTMLECDFI